jgi:preprotein translocase subunit SecB
VTLVTPGIQQESEIAMATTNGGPNPQAAFLPAINVLSQYVKDFSFENPNAPESLRGGGVQPSIQVEFNVGAKSLPGNDIEVELRIQARAEQEGKVLFNVELSYAGVFRIQNIPQEALQALVLIECPRMLFPFARQIISDATRNGGYPPLMIDPVDFARLYQERMLNQAQASQPQA